MYTSCKVFTLKFSHSLQSAYGKQLDVMTVVPSATESGIITERYIGTITSQKHAKAVIDALGQRTETRGHVSHAILPRIKQVQPLGLMIGLYNWR